MTADLPVGTRVRLRAPSPLLTLRSNLGTVVRPDRRSGYVVVCLDKPALYDDGRTALEELRDVVVAADNLEPLT